MRLLAVGLSHRTAPVELRESVDFARAGLDRALHALAARGVSPEAVVLSTCNRAEIYAVGDSDAAADAITGFFCDYHGLEPARLAAHLYCHRGVDAARHLFRVAAGLDSLVVGEPQILGQVKTAYADGKRPPLHRHRHASAVPQPRSRSGSASATRPDSAKAPSR